MKIIQFLKRFKEAISYFFLSKSAIILISKDQIILKTNHITKKAYKSPHKFLIAISFPEMTDEICDNISPKLAELTKEFGYGFMILDGGNYIISKREFKELLTEKENNQEK